MSWDTNIWGSIPDWIGAVGTIGALFMALWLFKDDRDRRANEEITRAARHVSAWSQVVGKDAPERFILSAKNTGEDPVYNCVLYSDLPIIDPVTGKPGIWMEDAEKEIPIEKWPFRVDRMLGILVPGELRRVEFLNKEVEREYQGLPDVWLEFTDASGRYWQRDRHGKLDQIAERTSWD